MLKKFFATILLAAIIFLGSQNHSAQANNIYIGTSGEGSDYYAMTETFGRFERENLIYSASLTVITKTGKIDFLPYTISEGENNSVFCTDDLGNKVEVSQSETPMVWGLYLYLKKFYGDS